MPLLTYDVGQVLLSREFNDKGEREPLQLIDATKTVQCPHCREWHEAPVTRSMTLGQAIVQLLDMDSEDEKEKRDLVKMREDQDLAMDITMVLRTPKQGTTIKIKSEKIDDLKKRLERVRWTRHQTSEVYKLLEKIEDEEEEEEPEEETEEEQPETDEKQDNGTPQEKRRRKRRAPRTPAS